MAYTNELSYLLEDDDKSIEPVHAVYLVSPIDAHQGRIQDFVLGGGGRLEGGAGGVPLQTSRESAVSTITPHPKTRDNRISAETLATS